MTLFRKPIKGDVIRNKLSGSLINVFTDRDYSGLWFEAHKSKYDFVTITVIEPPPEPLKTVKYFNLYKNPDDSLMVTSGTKTRQTADGLAVSTRVGCVRVEFVEGTFDD